MVQSDVMDTKKSDEDVNRLSSVALSSEQRLDEALTFIEDFLIEQNNHVAVQQNLSNKEVVLANLDILISRIQDILQQVDTLEK
ncbi:hypothetical protein HK18_05770 [Commensalibacter intestini]|uniref:Uncharacterized protein n=2 Tax=Commensalibacter intestini TaxID=479936 RepID=A0A251ZW54_9PROT|nr:hypothetical protein [Commensalibacter intestini]OUI78898.1 hypothetical protein HK18_05770 [Commensalibacter intestini]